MNFDTLNIADCIIPAGSGGSGGSGGGQPPDPRCSDAGFAASNPSICGSLAYLIIKPGIALVCKLGSINFSVFLYQNGIETEVTDGLTFTSSDEDILAIGVHTGAATGLAEGDVNVTVTRNGLTATSLITVLVAECGSGCECDAIHVKTSILIDDSKSMGLAFGGGYQSRLAFANAVALDYADKIIQTCGTSECVNLIPDGAMYGGNGSSSYVYLLVSVGIVTVGNIYQITWGANDSVLQNDPNSISSPGVGQTSTFVPGAQCELIGIAKSPVTATICNPNTGIGPVPKDSIKVWSFSDVVDEISTGYLTDTTELATEINGITQTQDMTDLGAILLAAVNDMIAAAADEKVIVLISDGEQTVTTDVQPILDTATLFKAAGGIIICIGLRASGTGYDLLSRIATGGFFLNAFSTNTQDILDGLNYLKSILCAGDCMTIAETTNSGALDYSSFINWEVIAGQVNLVGNGFLDFQPGNGLYVDMMGGAAGTIRSIDTFSLVAGRTYRISFEAAGNSRLDTPGANQNILVSILNSDPTVPSNLATIFSHVVSPNWDDPFTAFSFSFTAAFDVDVKVLFQQLYDTSFTGEWHGNLLDDIKFEEVSSFTTLLTDNFDGENPTSQPGNAYGAYCTSEVPGLQLQDPNPLPNVEVGTNPPPTTTYTSTKTACATCPSGNISLLTPRVVIPATYDDTSTPGTIVETYLSAVVASGYSVVVFQDVTQNWIGPQSFILYGSNDGINWVILDTQTGLSWANSASEVERDFSIPLTAAYTQFKMTTNSSLSMYRRFSFGINGSYVNVLGPTQVCQSATAASQISQADADNQATAAALALAQAGLNCVQAFTSTQQFTASCPAGSLGSSVTRSASATSLISQTDADNIALAAATAAANAALFCSDSNNSQKITINDNAVATPYPSVKFVSGQTGLISKVTVSINGLYHTWPDDIGMVLMSPAGTLVYLMGRCGGGFQVGTPTAGINLVFDDSAATNLPATLIAAGTYKPTLLGTPVTLPPRPPCPAGTIQSTLAAFNGENPNGSWALYINDNAALNVGTILNGFDLTITTTM
jgi:subtilisin-like proprotein convertase family protein